MIHSFLMIGQSNMAGRGLIHEVEEIKDPRIKMLQNGRWQIMTEPVNHDRSFSGVSLAPSFAAEWLKKYPEEEIGFIPCADGGTSLDDWKIGDALFENAVFQTKLAKRTSQLDGILWHQGETDCALENISVYSDKLKIILNELRSRLNAPDIPFIIGELGYFLGQCSLHDYFINYEKMNAVLRNFAVSNHDCYFVTADGLTSNIDLLHFNAVSQRKFGVRYFTAYNNRCNVAEPTEIERMYVSLMEDKTESEQMKELQLLAFQFKIGKLTRAEYDKKVQAIIGSM